MGKIISGIFGGAPKVPAITPVATPAPVETAPIVDTEAEKKKAKALRVSLYNTEGGAAGQELGAGSVSQRGTLLGN